MIQCAKDGCSADGTSTYKGEKYCSPHVMGFFGKGKTSENITSCSVKNCSNSVFGKVNGVDYCRFHSESRDKSSQTPSQNSDGVLETTFKNPLVQFAAKKGVKAGADALEGIVKGFFK